MNRLNARARSAAPSADRSRDGADKTLASATASTAGSPGSTTNGVVPNTTSPIASPTPPTSVATTGRLANIASITEYGNPSEMEERATTLLAA